MAAALPYVSAALGIASTIKSLQGPPQVQMPESPPTLSWDEAMRRATQTLTPVYDEQLQKTLVGVDRDLIARGFFGQLPGAVLSGSRALDVERAKAAAIASLGGQMQGQSEQNALAKQQLAAEWAINQSNLWNQAQQTGIQGLLGTLGQIPDLVEAGIFNEFGRSGVTTPAMQGVISEGWLTPGAQPASFSSLPNPWANSRWRPQLQ